MTVLYLVTSHPLKAQQILTVGFNPVADAGIYSFLSSQNYGATENMTISSSSSLISFYNRAYIQFDLSSIPSTATILSADLHFDVQTGNPVPLAFEKATASWNESTITWGNQAPVTSNGSFTSTAVTTIEGPFRNHEYNNTALKVFIQEWVNYPHLNFGMRLRLNDESTNASVTYSSREAGITNYTSGGTAAIRVLMPVLKVRYILPIKITPTEVIHATSSTASDGSIKITASQGNGSYSYQWRNSSGTSIGGNSSTVSNLPYGWYGVKVSDNNGNISFKSFLIGAECETVSIPYYPGPDYTDDAALQNAIINGQDRQDVNLGSYSWIQAEKWSSNEWYNHRTLLRFQLDIDPKLYLNKALLHLKGIDHSPLSRPNLVEFARVLNDWQEYVVTYNSTPPISGSGKILINTPTTSATQSDLIDFRSLWNYWQQHPNENFGVLFQLQDQNTISYTRRRYLSSDVVNTAEWPGLQLEVSIKCSEPVKLSEKRDGAIYYLYSNKLKFNFDEVKDAITGESLRFEIRNKQNTIIASSDLQGNTTGGINSVSHRSFANYHSLDLSSLNLVTGDYYTLIVYTISGKKLSLTFTKPN